MDDVIAWFSEKYGAFLSFIVEKIDQIFSWAWGLLRDFVCWVFESLLNIVIYALDHIDLDAMQGLNAWDGIPEQVRNVMGLLGVGQAATIIVGAVLIRLVLQLVPFTRLGS